MRKLLLLVMLPSIAVSAADLMMCNGEYALCAASGSTPTGKMITVKGKVFQEGWQSVPF
jgi:hypothetical protein